MAVGAMGEPWRHGLLQRQSKGIYFLESQPSPPPQRPPDGSLPDGSPPGPKARRGQRPVPPAGRALGGGRCLKPASVSAQPLRIGIPNVWAEVLPPTRGRDLGLKFTASLCGQWKSRASELAAEGVSSEASSDAVYGWNCPPWSRLGGTVFLVFSLREEKNLKSVKAAEEHSRGLSQADGNKPQHGGGRDVLTANAVGNFGPSFCRG